MYVPIKEAAFPVGAQSITLGQSGSWPGILRIFSAHWEDALINAVLPTPVVEMKTWASLILNDHYEFEAKFDYASGLPENCQVFDTFHFLKS